MALQSINIELAPSKKWLSENKLTLKDLSTEYAGYYMNVSYNHDLSDNIIFSKEGLINYCYFCLLIKADSSMKIIGLSLFVILFFAISGETHGQNLKENELVVIQGEKFILHQVRTGETIYSISKGFKVDSSELLKNNPGISQGLNIGDILKIPFNEDVELSEIPKYQKGDPTGFLNHTIKSRKETAYSISQMCALLHSQLLTKR